MKRIASQDAGICHDLFGIFIRDFNYIAIEGITEEGGRIWYGSAKMTSDSLFPK